ncbi:MAG TPA: TetR/AcrR family transcriptional regulator C-terminal domain-containing protein [Thermoleophilaceae bacterium]|jgi:AcrR family transcriptional regulator
MTPRTSSGLTRAAVAHAALQRLDAEGLDALSMRRLAGELGVGTMTLYGYFRSKEELLDAVVDAGFSEFEMPPAGDDFRTTLRDFALAARAVLVRHPALVEIRDAGPILRPRGFQVTELGVRILSEAGLGAEDAARSFRLLFDYVFGYAIVNRRPPSPELRREALASIVALPPEEFPTVTAVAEQMAEAVGAEGQFEYGLERILDGIEARLAASRAGRRARPGAPGARRRGTGPRPR